MLNSAMIDIKCAREINETGKRYLEEKLLLNASKNLKIFTIIGK